MELGKEYKVLCWVYDEDEITYIKIPDSMSDEQETWMDNEPLNWPSYTKKIVEHKTAIIPLIDHPHNDVENGQPGIHYHVDTRFNSELVNGNKFYRVYLPLQKGRLEYRMLKAIAKDLILSKTPVDLILKSKLKHKCIYKGKCPHRGYDLTNIEPVNGLITCPLHSLQFHASSGKLTNLYKNMFNKGKL